MQQTTNDTLLWFESELTARYQADLSGAHARAYLHEVREREDLSSQTSLDQQIDYLLEQWRYSLLDVALSQQSTIPPLDLLKALVVIEAYDQAIALTEHSLETLSISRADVFFDLGIFCLDLDAYHPKAALFFQHAFLSFTQHTGVVSGSDAETTLSYAKRLRERERASEAEPFYQFAMKLGERTDNYDSEMRDLSFVRILVELGLWEKAEAIIATHPNNLYLLAEFVSGLARTGQTERADIYFKKFQALLGEAREFSLTRIIDLYINCHKWQEAIALVTRSDDTDLYFVAHSMFMRAIESQTWHIAEQICDLYPNHRDSMLQYLVRCLLEQAHYLEAERVARRISEASYHRDRAFKEIIAAYAAAQCWSEARAIFQSLFDFAEYPDSLRSYLEMCIQEGALAEASQLLEKVARIDDRLIAEIQLAVAYQKQDHKANGQVALADLEERLIQLEAELESQQDVWRELAVAYAKLGLSEDLARAIMKLDMNASHFAISEEASCFLKRLVDQDAWQVAEQYACSMRDLELRSDLLAQLCLLLATRRRDRVEVLRLAQLNLMSRWQETRFEKTSWLFSYLVDAYIKAGLLNEAKQVIPLIPSDDRRRDTVSQIIPAFIQKQNWNETLELLEANQNHYQTPQFYKQLYLAIHRSGHHKLADSLAQATPFRDKLDQYNESQSRYKEQYQIEASIKQVLAQGKWKKAEQLLTQNFEPEYRAWFYKDLSLALLPKKRWNELIRITQFVENDTTMHWWYREEAYQRLIYGLVKAGRWRQALGVINTLEPGDSYGPRAQPDREELIFELISALVEQSLFKQALSIYNEISQPKCKLKSCLSIANGLAKANKWQRVEQLLKDINEDMVCEYGSIPTEILSELLLVCYHNQRNNILDGLCEWADRLIDTGIHQEYFTTLCLIGRFEQAEKLSKQYGYHSEQEAALSYMVEGLLKRKIFDKAEQVVFGMTHENLISRSYELIARYYLSYHERDRLVRFAQGAIRQADSYNKIEACQPLLMSLIALRPNKAQRMVDLLKQQIALEERLLELG
jgi:hypothetical protein